jgi:CheY-like chemotaxis protein
LEVHAGDGVVYERRGQTVFVPSPRSPPVGEPTPVEVRLAGGEVLGADAVVTKLRAAGENAPGSPAGFVLGLVAPDECLVAALEHHASAARTRRLAPRYPVCARATLTERGPSPEVPSSAGSVVTLRRLPSREGEVGRVENVSQGGAFVRTDANLPVGTDVLVDIDLPPERTSILRGTVVHNNEKGVGIRFDPEAGDAAVAETVARLAVHRRRALIVDDDLLSRRMLADALASKGFEVFSAADGTEGLRTLIDVLLGLDLLLLDLRMPGLDGEDVVRLVRGSGGERDLTIVVVSGTVEAAARERLTSIGADAVLSKGDGPAMIADTAVAALLRREEAARSTHGEKHRDELLG